MVVLYSISKQVYIIREHGIVLLETNCSPLIHDIVKEFNVPIKIIN